MIIEDRIHAVVVDGHRTTTRIEHLGEGRGIVFDSPSKLWLLCVDPETKEHARLTVELRRAD